MMIGEISMHHVSYRYCRGQVLGFVFEIRCFRWPYLKDPLVDFLRQRLRADLLQKCTMLSKTSIPSASDMAATLLQLRKGLLLLACHFHGTPAISACQSSLECMEGMIALRPVAWSETLQELPGHLLIVMLLPFSLMLLLADVMFLSYWRRHCCISLSH